MSEIFMKKREKYKQEIFIKAVLNDVESVSKVSTCKKMEKFDHQS